MTDEILKKVQTFFKSQKSQKYTKGKIIIDPSSAPTGLFYLEQGIVRQYAISSKGEEITINIFKSPSLFPVGWVINDIPEPYYFDTMSPVSVWVAPKKDALGFLKTNSDVVFDLMQRIYKGLNGYFVRVENLMTGNARSRLITHILLHDSRFGAEKLKVSESDLASQSGITRETVSRQLQYLREKGLVRFKSGILEIADVHKLEEELLIDK